MGLGPTTGGSFQAQSANVNPPPYQPNPGMQGQAGQQAWQQNGYAPAAGAWQSASGYNPQVQLQAPQGAMYGQQMANAYGRQMTNAYGQPPAMGVTGAGTATFGPHDPNKYRNQIRDRLWYIIQTNELQRFPAYANLGLVDNLASAIATKIDLDAVCRDLNMPWELALQLLPLCLYHVIFYIDDSSSMSGENWRDVTKLVGQIAKITHEVGTTELHFMNSDQSIVELQPNLQSFMALFAQVQPCGMTPFGTELQNKILSKIEAQQQFDKPYLIWCPTDGVPNDETHDKIGEDIIRARDIMIAKGYPAESIAFSITHIGNNPADSDYQDAEDHLERLAKDARFADHVDVVLTFEAESQRYMKGKGHALTQCEYLVKTAVGAIDVSWCENDGEHAHQPARISRAAAFSQLNNASVVAPSMGAAQTAFGAQGAYMQPQPGRYQGAYGVGMGQSPAYAPGGYAQAFAPQQQGAYPRQSPAPGGFPQQYGQQGQAAGGFPQPYGQQGQYGQPGQAPGGYPQPYGQPGQFGQPGQASGGYPQPYGQGGQTPGGYY